MSLVTDDLRTIGSDATDWAADEIDRLQQWLSDLQSGMYINCVYCGHRYGPRVGTPVAMADILKEHIEQCPKHPLSEAKAEIERLQTIVDKLPKTADGVPVVPGMVLHDPIWIEDPFGVHQLLVFCPNARRSEWSCNDGEVDTSQCYSTREAAQAAKEKA